jgi:flagellar protein FlaG
VTKLEGARSEQVATVNPSPPSVVSVPKQSTVAVVQPAPEVKAASQQSFNQGKPPTVEEIERAAKQIESYLKSVGRELEFSIDDSTGRTVITVKDATTGEVVRQIPGDETLRLARLASTSNKLVDIEA